MKTASHRFFAALSVAALTFAFAAGCDDGSGNNGADGTVKIDTTGGGDGTTGTPDGTSGTDTTATPDGATGTDTTVTPDGAIGTDTTVTPDGTIGTDTTVTPDGNPPAPFCGDTLCNGGESSLTCPGDCGASTSKLLCPQVAQCLVQECTANITQACFSSTTAAGGACATDTGELGPWLDSNNCVAGCTQPATVGGTPPAAADAYGCVVSNCVGLTAKCYSGGDVGGGDCAAIAGCLNSCGTPNLSATYGTCARACVAAAKQKSAAAFFATQLCLAIMCPNATTTADKCVQDVSNPATSPPGLCAAAIDACENDGAVVIADPTPDAGGDTGEPDASTPDATTPDAQEDVGPMPDTTPTPDASGDASGSSGFAPFFGARYLPERYQQGGRF